MIWDIVRLKVTLMLPAFYKRIQGRNVEQLKVKGPVIIAMNHPNAFTDPVAITYLTYPLKLKYLARGDAFKPGLISWLLEQLGIVPIFRIQDGGKEGLKKNDEAYRRVNNLLKRNHKIIVFAEGLCIQERRLRPLKKGVARMVFGAYDFLENEELCVIPVGVNYSQPDKFRSTVFYNVGEPMFIKDFQEGYNSHPAKAYNRFLLALEPKMKELITHIQNPHNDELVPQIEVLVKKKLLKEKNLNPKNLYHDFLVTKEITDKINRGDETNSLMMADVREKTKNYFDILRKEKLRDWLIDPFQNQGINAFTFSVRCILLVFGFPFFLIGLIGNYLPYKVSEWVVKKLIKANNEFYSSMVIGISMVLIWLTYIAWFFIIYSATDVLIWPLLAVIVFGLTGWFNLYFYFFMLKTAGIFRFLRNPKTVEILSVQRKKIIDLLNNFLYATT
jgi:glycerol-3-phosphate O-acyltransferase / dihydroxyacetone phosphate acyltransferase